MPAAEVLTDVERLTAVVDRVGVEVLAVSVTGGGGASGVTAAEAALGVPAPTGLDAVTMNV